MRHTYGFNNSIVRYINLQINALSIFSIQHIIGLNGLAADLLWSLVRLNVQH